MDMLLHLLKCAPLCNQAPLSHVSFLAVVCFSPRMGKKLRNAKLPRASAKAMARTVLDVIYLQMARQQVVHTRILQIWEYWEKQRQATEPPEPKSQPGRQEVHVRQGEVWVRTLGGEFALTELSASDTYRAVYDHVRTRLADVDFQDHQISLRLSVAVRGGNCELHLGTILPCLTDRQGARRDLRGTVLQAVVINHLTITEPQ